jgi:hypothetical protein
MSGKSINGTNRIVMGPYKGPNKTRHHSFYKTYISLKPSNLAGKALYIKGSDVPVETTNYMALVRGQNIRTLNSFVEITPSNGVFTYVYKDDDDLKNNVDLNQDDKKDYGPKRRLKRMTTGLLLHVPDFMISSDLNYSEETREKLFNLILDEYCEALRIDRADVGVSFSRISVAYDKNTRGNENFVFFHDVVEGAIGLTHGLLTDKEHNIFKVLQRIAKKIDAKHDKHLLRALRALYQSILGLRPAEPEKVLRSGKAEFAPPENCVLMIPPGEYGLMDQFNGSSTKVRIVRPAYEMGTLGYYIEKIDRKRVFGENAYSVSVNVADLGAVNLQADARQKGNARRGAEPVEHFVSAAHIVPSGDFLLVAFHKKTNEIFQLSDALDGTWEPLPKVA